MNILIPMAGDGTRFREVGYQDPKPLIDVAGTTMISRVINEMKAISSSAHFIFVVRASHLRDYKLADELREATAGNCSIITVDSVTEGAACTVLLAQSLIDNAQPLVIANSDQLVDFDPGNFQALASGAIAPGSRADGIIFCFHATDPKWSFARLNHQGEVIEVAEKRPISDIATCGVYWFRKGSLFVAGAKKMIARDARVRGEFYVAPVYDELIGEGRRILPFMVERMRGLGTPEDLECYLQTTPC